MSCLLHGSDESPEIMRRREMSATSSSSSTSSSRPPHSVSEAVVCESSEQVTHTLRSKFHYTHPDVFIPRRPDLLKAFNDVYRPFKEGQKIPDYALAKLEEFTIDEPTFVTLVTKRELEKGRFIYLEDGKIKFDTYTMPPHAEVIINIVKQIERQNSNPELFLGGTAGGGTTIYKLTLLILCRCYFARISQTTRCPLDHKDSISSKSSTSSQCLPHRPCYK
jgi:hypothetical protein